MKSIHNIVLPLVSLTVPVSGSCSGDDRRAASEQQDSQQQPNVILIYADDLGYGDLGCYGHPTISTHNIDYLAEQGVRMTSFYASSAVSSPSRAALLTARYPVRSGMYGDRESVLFPDTPTGLPTEETTLAEVLKQAGYETGLIGKWHLGHASPYLPDNHGFNYFYGLYSPHNYTTLPLMENHRGVYQDAPLPELTQLYATKAEEFVRRNSNKPFFLFYSHSYPHVPVHSSEDFTGKSLAGRYGDAVEEIDWSVGRLLEVLRECEIDSQTLIIFTSDNGPSLKHTPIQGGGAGLLRGGKGSQWEGGFRVPCIFWYPAELPSGEVNMGMASQLDLMPTITSFCNAFMPLGSVIDGIDIMPLLCGDAAKEREQFAYWIGSDLRALRKGRYKAHFTVPAVWYNETPFPRDTSHTDMLLFDIQTDPYEVNNLFKKNPGIVREFIKLRDQYQEGIPITPSIFDRRPEGSTTL